MQPQQITHVKKMVYRQDVLYYACKHHSCTGKGVNHICNPALNCWRSDGNHGTSHTKNDILIVFSNKPTARATAIYYLSPSVEI